MTYQKVAAWINFESLGDDAQHQHGAPDFVEVTTVAEYCKKKSMKDDLNDSDVHLFSVVDETTAIELIIDQCNGSLQKPLAFFS